MKPATACLSDHRAVHRAIGGKANRPPVRHGGADAPGERGEHAVYVLAQLGQAPIALLKVLPERQRADDLDGVGGEGLLDRQRQPAGGRIAQRVMQPLGRDVDDLEVAVQVRDVQRGDRQATLAAPVIALGREHPRDLHLPGHLGQLAPAPKPVRPVAQDRVDHHAITDPDHRPRP